MSAPRQGRGPLWIGLSLCVMACGGGAPPDEVEVPVEAAPEPRPPRQLHPIPTVISGEEGEPTGGSVALAFEGVGRLHRGFFSQPDRVGPMVAALQPCLSGEGVVSVSWDSEQRLGRITLEVAPGTLRCTGIVDGEGLDLRGLQPVGAALADFRDAVANASDLRVASFRGELLLLGEPPCRLRLGGTFPPDGSAWHHCVELDGRSVCQPAEPEGSQRLELPDSAAQQALRACFSG